MRLTFFTQAGVALAVLAAGCRQPHPPGAADSDRRIALVESFNFAPGEYDKFVKRADAGDPKAALRLGEYFALAALDDRQALRYYRLAAKNGGKRERDILQSYVETHGAGDE